MHGPTAAELLQRPPADPASEPESAASEWRWLGRFGRIEALRQRAEALRGSPGWSARRALELALALRLAGAPLEADALILEADRLAPALRLVPDRWAQWPVPAPAAGPPADAQVAAELLQRLRLWRWLDAAALERSWLERHAPSWRQGLDEAALDQLALLLHHGPGPSEAFRHALVQLVGEAEMAAHPGPAAAFWGFLADADPGWDYAVIRAAELALQRGQHQRAAAWLHAPSGALAANPWCHDLAARLALAQNRIADALGHWDDAIARCSGGAAAEHTELVEIFRQRRREARRGPGLLHARALIERGDTAQARSLLLQLVEQDPQWQPLRSLLAQLEQASPPAASGPERQSGPPSGPEAELARFAHFLERIAAQRGLALPTVHHTSAASSDTHSQRLEAFAASLAAAEGRLALHA